MYIYRQIAQHGEVRTTAWYRGVETAEEWWKFYGDARMGGGRICVDRV